MRLGMCVAVAAMTLAAPAMAGLKFAAYEGPSAVRHGEGGTRVTKNGIDYWTTGTPPRLYQIIGILTDRRYDDWDPSLVGSPGVAKETKRLGGHAVIILNEKSQMEGYVVPVGASVLGGTDTKLITQ